MDIKSIAALVLSSSMFVLLHATAQEMPVVVITGERPSCTGDCGAPIMETAMPSGPSGNGVVGSNTSYGWDDRTRGTSMGNNRQPGCQREDAFTMNARAELARGGLPGTMIMSGPFGDDLFKTDPNWRKYETEEISSRITPGSEYKVVYRTQVHYMYNIATNQYAQMKLKNSFEYGCMGIYMRVGTMTQS